MEHQLYWGDFHCNIVGYHTKEERAELIKEMETVFAQAHGYVDFFPMAYYPFYYYHKKGFLVESYAHEKDFEEHWERLRALVKKYNEDGVFTTFMGYEWHGNREYYGDHNVYFYSDDANMCTESSLEALYAYLRQEKGLAIPHHTAYKVHQRGKDWSVFDEQLSPFSEIYSGHGLSECTPSPVEMTRNIDMGPRVSGGTAQDGLARGYHFGFIASADNQNNFVGRWGCGLAAAYATDLSREGLWDAFVNRRVYAVTGDRIGLEYFLNGACMGSILPVGESTAHIRVRVRGCAALDRIEILKNNRVLHTCNCRDTWDAPQTGRVTMKQRITVGYGPNGFGPEKHTWNGRLNLSGGRIVSIEKTFTSPGNRCETISEREAVFTLISRGRTFMQGIVFEIEADTGDMLHFEINGHVYERTVANAMSGSDVMAYVEECKELVQQELGLSPAEVENHEMYYHHAYKAKFHQAVPEVGYTKELEWRDVVEPQRENAYYIRVSQLNGQMAWSSPIWVQGK